MHKNFGQVVSNISNSISIISTQGSAQVDDADHDNNASNLLIIKGTPAHYANVSLVGNGYILSDPLKRKTAKIFLNSLGYGYLNICKYIDSNNEPLLIYAYDLLYPDNIVSTISTYSSYRSGSGRFQAVNNTYNIPAQSNSYCSINTLIEQSIPKQSFRISHVNVTLTSLDLLLLNPSTTAADKVEIASDSTANILIGSRSSGTKQVYLSLDESPDGEFIVLDIVFTTQF